MSLRRAAVIAVLVLLMALTPLSAVLSGGVFETWLPGSGRGISHNPLVRVVLEDRTGLVRTIGPGHYDGHLDSDIVDPPGTQMTLIVNWLGGCGDHIAYLTFESFGEGYRIQERTEAWGCGFDVGYSRTLAIGLWAPIDASTVQFVSVGHEQVE